MGSEDAELRLAIMEALAQLRTDLDGRLHSIDIRLESLATTTRAQTESLQRHLTEIDRRIGGNEAAIKATMDWAHTAAEQAREADDAIRADLARLEARMEADAAEERGRQTGAEDLRRTLQWGLGIIVTLLTIFGALGLVAVN